MRRLGFPPPGGRKGGYPGFSTAEVVLSAFILSLLIMTLMTLFPSSAMAVKRGENRIQADWIAQSALEQLRAAPFKSMGFYTTDLGSAIYGGTNFTRTQEVFRVYGEDERFLKGVRVTIAWTERDSQRSLVQESWICSVEK